MRLAVVDIDDRAWVILGVVVVLGGLGVDYQVVVVPVAVGEASPLCYSGLNLFINNQGFKGNSST